jgi:uncharacterized protein (TIGR03382 family)
MRRCVAPLLFTLVAAFHTVVPTRAEAASALFSVVRTSYSDGIGDADQTRTASFPTANGYVGTTSPPRFTVPQSILKDTTGYNACQLGVNCRPAYPVSKAWYSYWNLRGSFRPNNPYAPTVPMTVRFPTTMGNTGSPIGTGEPATPTTTFGGRYDFSRHGSIMITPGPNRFGGTMQFFYGPNQRFYQYITYFYPYISKAYGGGQPNLSANHESQVGEFVIGPEKSRFHMTTYGQNRITTGTPNSPGDDYLLHYQYISTIVPFTTGMITGYQPVGPTATAHTLTGYDNRTPNGLSGVISLVRARLVHSYGVPFHPDDPIQNRWSRLSSWRIDFHFLPEPGGTAMLAAGVVALALLYRRRRYSVER